MSSSDTRVVGWRIPTKKTAEGYRVPPTILHEDGVLWLDEASDEWKECEPVVATD